MTDTEDGQCNNPQDDAPPAAYTELLAHIAQVARDQLQEGKEQLAVAFLIHDGQIGDILAAAFEDDGIKDGFAAMVRQRASKMKPEAIVMVSEAWSLPKEWSTPEKYAEFKKMYKQIADAPFKIDVLWLKLETYDGEWMGHAEIQQAAQGRSFGALEWMKGAPRSHGRFMGLLPVVYLTPQQVTDYMAVARRKFDAAGFNIDDMLQNHTLAQVIEKNIRQAPANRVTPALFADMIDMMLAGAVAFKRPRKAS